MQQPDFLKFEIVFAETANVLFNSPIGWENSAFKEDLVDAYHVMVRAFSTPLKFPFEGGKLLRSIFYNQGFDAVSQLRISKRNNSTFKYEVIVVGDFDFSTFSDEIDGVSINIMERGISANVKAFEDVTYDIPIDSNGGFPINIGGIGVNESGNVTYAIEQATGLTGGYNAFIGKTEITGSDVSEDFVILSPSYASKTLYLGEPVGDSFFAIFQANFNCRFYGHIKGTGAGWRLYQKIYFYLYADDGMGGRVGHLLKLFTVSSSSGLVADFDFDVTLPVQAGQKWSVMMFSPFENEGDHKYSFDFLSIDVFFGYRTYTVDYVVRGLSAFDLFKALMRKINAGNNTFVNCQSILLTSEPWRRLVMLSGDSIRGVPGAVIKTSFKDFFTSIDALLCCGFKITGSEARIEQRSYFYNPSVRMVDIGPVSNAVFEAAADFGYSKLTVGYEDQEYRTVDGKDEFNTEESWSADSIRVQETLEIKSLYRADPRGIDQLLIDFRAKLTQDTRADKDVFMVKRSDNTSEGIYTLEGVEAYQEVSGVSSLGRTYNIDLSPRHMLMRHSGVLAIPFALRKEGVVVFNSSKKNAALRTVDFDGTITNEQDPIDYTKMYPALFLPVYVTFTSGMSDKIYYTLQANRYTNGYIQFTWRSKIYKGFLVNQSFDIVKKSSKEIKLLLTLDSNLPV